MMFTAIRVFFVRRLKQSWENARRVHLSRLRTDEGRIRLGIAILLYVLLSWAIVQDDLRLGFSFVFAGFIAIYTGVIYKRRDSFAYVIGGVILATAVLPTFLDAWKAIKNGEWIGAIIVFCLGILLWFWSSRMKAGEPPVIEGRRIPTRRTRKSTKSKRPY
jgi:hypothetical protein